MNNSLTGGLIIVVLIILDFLIYYLMDPGDITLRTESYEKRKRKRFLGLMIFISIILFVVIYNFFIIYI